MNILSYYSLANECSFQCGGKARWYCEVESLNEFINLLKLHNNNDFFILGKGTNTLCSDKGYNNLVISTKKLNKISFDNGLIVCECGVGLIDVNNFMASKGLTGLEWSYGIPGSIGGACIMNASAFGGQIGNFIEKVEVWRKNKIEIINKSQLNFSYRESSLKNIPILRVWLKLQKDNKEKIVTKMNEIIAKRKKSQPLEFGSAGSVFKRNGDIVPAKIIEKLGLKGFTIGGAEISTKHAGFIINKKNATATEIINLIDFIQKKVKIEMDINLEKEVIILEKE